MVGDAMTRTQATPSCQPLTAETRSFCPDPKAGRAFPPPLKLVTATASPPSDVMGSCYPKCMGESDGFGRSTSSRSSRRDLPTASASLYADNQASETKPVDLEELGAAAAEAPQMEQRVVVDYEDSDGEHPQPRSDAAACAPSACGLLEDKTELVGSRRRSRTASDAALAASRRGKSVIFEQDKQETSTSTSVTEEEEPARCSKVQKLCMCELQLHRSLESCWLVSSGQVYDVTGLVTAHPGGVRSILRKAGGPDCARDMKFHTKKARKMMEKCFIGKLEQCGDDVDCAGESNCSIM